MFTFGVCVCIYICGFKAHRLRWSLGPIIPLVATPSWPLRSPNNQVLLCLSVDTEDDEVKLLAKLLLGDLIQVYLGLLGANEVKSTEKN